MRALGRGLAAATWLSGALAVAGCGGGSNSSTGAFQAEAPAQPTEQAKCKVAASHENPLVTEWPASEKANLEARLREGGVVVSYAGCAMRLLPQCRVRGKYNWRRTTTSTDVVEIHNADELYAKLPLGAVSLEGELERSGRIAVQTTVSGQMELKGWDHAISSDASCSGATHVVGALSVGAFKLRSGGSLSARGGVGVAGIGAGASTESAESVIREAGNPESCKDSSDETAAGECSSPVQVFLWPLPRTMTDRGAPGQVKVNFLSATADRNWDVVVNDRVVCKTPCEKWVDPSIPYGMRFDPGWWQRDEVVDFDLRPFKEQAPLQVRGHPRRNGKLFGGLVMTTFGGVGILTGITFVAAGCSGDSFHNLCTPGLIVLPIGIALTIPGVLLMLNSGAYADVEPATGKAPQSD